MKLQDFVSETLTQIVNGVRDAQENAAKVGGQVNPDGYQVPFKHLQGQRWNKENGDTIDEVHFDVAITTEEGAETKGGIGVFVGAIGLGSQGASAESNSSVSKVQFSVPVAYPKQSGT